MGNEAKAYSNCQEDALAEEENEEESQNPDKVGLQFIRGCGRPV